MHFSQVRVKMIELVSNGLATMEASAWNFFPLQAFSCFLIIEQLLGSLLLSCFLLAEIRLFSRSHFDLFCLAVLHTSRCHSSTPGHFSCMLDQKEGHMPRIAMGICKPILDGSSHHSVPQLLFYPSFIFLFFNLI